MIPAGPDRETHWFALHTKPRHEKVAAEWLRLQELPHLLPLYPARHRWSDRWQTVEMPLFPGYLFCRFAAPQYRAVVQIPGVRRVVGFAGRPAPVADGEMAALERLLGAGRALAPWPYLRSGQRVRVTAGPLAGVEGILVRQRSATRVVVSVELLQRSVAVELEREALVAAAAWERI